MLALAIASGHVSGAPFAYISNSGSDTVSVIDVGTNAVVGSPIPVGASPYGVAANAQGTRVYVANTGSNSVSVIDTSTQAVVATIPLGWPPRGVAVDRTGTRAYVAHAAGVSVIDTGSNTVLASITLPYSPGGDELAVNPTGTRVYVTQPLGVVSAIDTATNTAKVVWDDPSVSMDGWTRAVDVDPAGQAYFGYAYDILYHNLEIIDPVTDRVSIGMPTFSRVYGVAASPTGSDVFVSVDGWAGAPRVQRFDTSTKTFTGHALVGGKGVAVDPTGSRVVVVNETGDSVSVIDAATMQVIGSPIPVGNTPIALGKFIGPAPPAQSPPVHWFYNGANVINPALPIGTTAVWRVTPGAGVGGVTFPAVLPNGWSGAGASADMSGDGVPDLIWAGPLDGSTQPISRWIMDIAGNVAATEPVCDCAGPIAEWGLGDFDRDGRADLIVRSASGKLRVGYMPASGAISSWRDYGDVPQEWSLRGVGDLDGNGIADIVWFRPSDGAVAIWLMQLDGTFTPAFPAGVGTQWQPYKVADIDGDGKADIWWRHDDGTNAVWYMNGGAIDATDFFVGTPLAQWTLGSAIDLNLDGSADLLWYGPDAGAVVRWTMRGRHLSPVVDALPGVGPGWQIVQ